MGFAHTQQEASLLHLITSDLGFVRILANLGNSFTALRTVAPQAFQLAAS